MFNFVGTLLLATLISTIIYAAPSIKPFMDKSGDQQDLYYSPNSGFVRPQEKSIATEPEVSGHDDDMSNFRFIESSAMLPENAEQVGDSKNTEDAFAIGFPVMEQDNSPSSNDKAFPDGFPQFKDSFTSNFEQTAKAKTVATEPITNPAAFFLKGASFDRIKKPKCEMIGCDGPFAEDIMSASQTPFKRTSPSNVGETCTQTFVAMNSCTSDKGYKTGMVCTICCECSSEFVEEMVKTVGFKESP
uniref:ShKT domain-containing protein n=1 Tax=Rhabditophanes sp. KR3021 TaxID=114890 RepID=A0AC35UGU3_9BILA